MSAANSLFLNRHLATKNLTRLREWVYFYPTLLFIAVRVWLSLWASVSAQSIPVPAYAINQYYGITPLSSALDKIVWAPWQRWDTIWYTKIAEQGYSSNDLSVAFFPLFPLLIKIVSPLTANNFVAAGVIISSLAALVSFALLYKFTTALYGEATARRTVLYLAAFPTAFFLFAAYTESLFLALTLGALLAANAQRWEFGAVLGGLAALTRPQGILLIVPLAVEFFLQYRRREVSLVRVLNLGIVLVGALSYLIFLTVKFQDPWLWFKVQSWWHRASLPWESIGAAFTQIFHSTNFVDALISLPDEICAVLFLSFIVWSFFRLAPTLTAYMAIIVLPPLFGLTTYSPYLPLASMSRYVLVAFPAFVLLGRVNAFARLRSLLIAFSFVFQTVWLILFVAWVFVG
jgi:Gpi18-like mannosyltransferase